jgi:glycosyltransferase involved in cell wall biosynthesis
LWILRVGFFTDSYYEANGVATTSRLLEAYARKRHLPFLTVRPGPALSFSNGESPHIELQRGLLSLSVEFDMCFDPLLWRYFVMTLRQLRQFRPDVIHVTSPGDVGLLGIAIAKALGVYVIGSWHTNLHDFAASRLAKSLRHLPSGMQSGIASAARSAVLWSVLQFYQVPRLVVAPNSEILTELERRMGRSVYLLPHGVDTTLFDRRKRRTTDCLFRIGYVGRIVPEKNVRAFCSIERRLIAAGCSGFRFVIIGEGSEREWLERNLIHADFPGVLRGEELAQAYAGMDLLVFPSETDTFGLVVLEAMASGVPCIVSNRGGPQSIVKHGVTGFVADNEESFADCVIRIMTDPKLQAGLSLNARRQAEAASWDSIFERMWNLYEATLTAPSCRSRLFFNSP